MVLRILSVTVLAMSLVSVAHADIGHHGAHSRLLRDEGNGSFLEAPIVGPLLSVSRFDAIAMERQPLRLQSLSSFDLVHARFSPQERESYFVSLSNSSATRLRVAPTGPLLSVTAFDALSR